jgi:hypothetical protein
MKSLPLITLLIISSCAVNYQVADNRFITPESNGALGSFSLQTGYGQGKEVELASEFSDATPNTVTPLLTDSDGFFLFGGSFGLSERFDIGLRYTTDEGGALNAKFMAAGKSGQTGLQLALAGHIGKGKEERITASNNPSISKLDLFFMGGDLILGYRMSPTILTYLSAFHDTTNYELDHTLGVVGSTLRTFEGGSTNYGGTAGLQYNFGPHGSFIFEAARGHLKSRESILTSSSYGGILNLQY